MKSIIRRILIYLAGASVACAAVENQITNLGMLGSSNELSAGYTLTLQASSVLTTAATATVTLTNATVNYPVGQITDTAASLAEKPAVLAASTVNVASLSGTVTIDAIALTAGQTVLLTGQTTASQNGPWVIAAGAWTRPTWYPNGGTLQAYFGVVIEVLTGTANQGSQWYISTSSAITIGTTAVTFTEVKFALSSSSATLLPSLVTDSTSSLTEKPITKAVATANVASLSGTTTIDSVALVAGDAVLLSAQTTASQNGPWLVQSSTWTRPTWYGAANTTQAFFGVIVPVVSGSLNAGSRWYITTTGAITIDTTSTAWTKIPGNGGSLALLSDVSLSSPTNSQVLTYNGSVWINANATGGGGGTLNGVIGSATFNPSSGSIVGLVKTGVISAVTRTSTGLYAVTVSPATTGYTIAVTASDDSTTSTDAMIAGTSISTSAFSVTTRASTTGTVRDPNVVHITVLGTPTSAYIQVSDTKASTTNGGTPTASAWTTRALTTIDADTTGAASLSANAITIPAGTWRVYARSPFFQTGVCRIRLFDQTNTAVLLTGSNSYSIQTAANVSADCVILGRFTAATSIAVRVEYFVGFASGGTIGLGVASSTASTSEVYTQLYLTRE